MFGSTRSRYVGVALFQCAHHLVPCSCGSLLVCTLAVRVALDYVYGVNGSEKWGLNFPALMGVSFLGYLFCAAILCVEFQGRRNPPKFALEKQGLSFRLAYLRKSRGCFFGGVFPALKNLKTKGIKLGGQSYGKTPGAIFYIPFVAGSMCLFCVRFQGGVFSCPTSQKTSFF